MALTLVLPASAGAVSYHRPSSVSDLQRPSQLQRFAGMDLTNWQVPATVSCRRSSGSSSDEEKARPRNAAFVQQHNSFAKIRRFSPEGSDEGKSLKLEVGSWSLRWVSSLLI